MTETSIQEPVRERYAAAARAVGGCCGAGAALPSWPRLCPPSATRRERPYGSTRP